VSVRRVACAIAANDLRLELRRPVLLGTLALFGGGGLVASHLALAGSSHPPPLVAAGALWIVLLFAAAIGCGRMLTAERERGTWPALLLAPADRTAIFAGKTLSTLCMIGLLHLVLAPIFAALFAPDVSVRDAASVVLVVALFDIGISALGILLGLLSMAAGARELLGPVLLVPLAMPPLLVATASTVECFDPTGSGLDAKSAGFLLAYAGFALAAGVAAFAELAVE
jgi:ABC-type transport system involved in cytochrome c biogenesis permease component